MGNFQPIWVTLHGASTAADTGKKNMTIQARATANSIFGLGIYLGGAFASLGAFVDEQELGKTTQGTRVTQRANH